MEFELKYHEKSKLFSEIEEGDCFEFEDVLYLKVYPCAGYPHNGFNAVSLVSNTICVFDDDDAIEPRKAKLVVGK